MLMTPESEDDMQELRSHLGRLGARSVLVAVGLALVGRAAIAGPHPNPISPSPVYSTVPPVVRLVGLDANGAPSADGSFTVIVRNGFNNRCAGYLVILTFVNCAASRIASSGYPAGITVDCRPDRRTVRRITDANGEATFIVPGTMAGGMSQAQGCMSVSSEGAFLANVSVSSADLDGQAGVGTNDLAAWLQAFGTQDPSAADYNGNHVVDANDLSFWLTVFGSGAEVATPASLCP